MEVCSQSLPERKLDLTSLTFLANLQEIETREMCKAMQGNSSVICKKMKILQDKEACLFNSCCERWEGGLLEMKRDLEINP